MEIEVKNYDIGLVTSIEADALLITVCESIKNPIDEAVSKAAPDHEFYENAIKEPIYVKSGSGHKGIKGILYMPENPNKNNQKITKELLCEAEKLKMETIVIFSRRVGDLAGAFEIKKEALRGLDIGIKDFIKTNPVKVKNIVIIVNGDQESEKKLNLLLNN